MNKVILEGNLGKDAIVRVTADGTAVANISVATTEIRKKREADGTITTASYTEWHRVVAWRNLAETMGKIYKKGKQVLIEGRMQTRKWTDSEGIERYTTEVVASFAKLLGRAPGAGANEPPLDAYEDDMPGMMSEGGVPPANGGIDDDIPF